MISIYFLFIQFLPETSMNKLPLYFRKPENRDVVRPFLKRFDLSFPSVAVRNCDLDMYSCKCSRGRTLLPDMWIYNTFDAFANRLIRHWETRIGGWGVPPTFILFFLRHRRSPHLAWTFVKKSPEADLWTRKSLSIFRGLTFDLASVSVYGREIFLLPSERLGRSSTVIAPTR